MPFTTTENLVTLGEFCPIEDAEALHDVMREIGTPVFDLGDAKYLHTAIVQLILAAGAPVRILPRDPILASCFGSVSAG